MTVKLSVKVVPKSSRDCIAGWLGEALKIRVRAPAERGKANAAVEQLLAETLGVAKKSVQVVSGKTSPQKVVEIAGLSETEVADRLANAASS